MRIAIIEDEALELAQLTDRIQELEKKEVLGVSFDISKFRTIEDFETADLKADMLILDLHLPDGNGLDLARRLKSERTNTGISALCAVTATAMIIFLQSVMITKPQ